MRCPKVAILGIAIFILYFFIQLFYNQAVAQDERGFVSGSAIGSPANANVTFTEMIDMAYQNLALKNYDKSYIEFKLAFKDAQAAKYKNSKDVNWLAINNDFGRICDTLGTRLLATNTPEASVKYFVESIIPYFNADNQDAIFSVTEKMAKVSLANPSEERYDNAIKKYQDFLMHSFRKRITDIDLIGNAHYKIANLLVEKGNKDTALVSLKEAVLLYKSPKQQMVIYKRLADFYKFLRESKNLPILIYEEAADYFKGEIAKTADHELQANLFLIKADFELKRGRSGSFYKDYTSAINLFQEDNNPVGATQTCMKAAQSLYEAAEYNKAIAYLEEGKKIIGKVSDKSNPDVKHTTEQLQNLLEDVQRREKLETIKGENVTLDEQLEEQQRQFLTIISLVLTSALVFVGISFYNARKSNVLLQRKNEEIHQQKEQISFQHQIIEKKSKGITDSLRYGKTIQQALLPSKEKLESAFGECFVFFRPKDIVSGDFYWHSRLNDKEIIAAVDCTGHGVPGAFMSMIGHTLLSEIVNQHKISDPAQILGLLHNNIRKVLHQSTEDGNINDDGMDACLCVIEPIDSDTKEPQVKVTFAGAKRPLLYIPKPYTAVRHIRGDRKSIGGMQKEEVRVFNSHELILPKGSLLYLLSDGYPDQNGTDKGNFSTKKLEQLLLDNAQLPMARQKEILSQELATHQQQAEQRDDITIIGVRV